ncbi:MAG TPA: glycosyltransferase family 4 protein [Thermoanaerobaculia bacterium]|nr:glycosyltransferase family 4 protein [Thermoanaerobaculia bacterium]
MRILILTPRLPWPPLDGGRVAMSRLAESLARCGAEVEVLSLNPRKHRGVARGPLPVRAIDIDTSRVAGPALRAMTSRMPYVVARFVSRAFADAIDDTMRRFAPDVVQVESPFLIPYAKRIRGARCVLRSMNVEFHIWEGLARNERDPLRRFALKRVAASLRGYEVRAMNALDAIVPISDADRDDFRLLGCTRPMHVVPCGVTLPDLGDSLPDPTRVGFLGSLDYRPNQNAVTWILDELWPRVVRRMPEARLSIAGSAPPDWLRDRATERDVELLADVPDAHAFMRRMSVLLAPLFAGGGMRIKVLEAMALGKPIVATALGAGGIEVEHERDILLAEESDAFADVVVRLLRDSTLAARIGNAARARVATLYDNDALARGLLRFYESL